MPAGPMPAGAGAPSLLHAAGASIEATVLCVERAQGAAAVAAERADDAGHTGGLSTLPRAYERRVVAFFDHALLEH